MRQRITLSDEDLKDAAIKWLELKLDKGFDPAEWQVILGARSESTSPRGDDEHWVAEVTLEHDTERKKKVL